MAIGNVRIAALRLGVSGTADLTGSAGSHRRTPELAVLPGGEPDRTLTAQGHVDLCQ
jgi:hypothetical protein